MVARIVNWFRNLFKSKEQKTKKRFISDDVFNDMKKKREDKMNSILDKIARKGYESLSQHEKNFLDNYSRNK